MAYLHENSYHMLYYVVAVLCCWL